MHALKRSFHGNRAVHERYIDKDTHWPVGHRPHVARIPMNQPPSRMNGQFIRTDGRLPDMNGRQTENVAGTSTSQFAWY